MGIEMSQHHMSHEQLLKIVEKRLDKIEEKLDKHLEQVSKNTADISWVRGHIKLGLGAVVGLTTGLLTLLFKVFIKQV